MSLPFLLPQLKRVSDSMDMVDQTVTRFERIDILVNSAGAYLGKRAEDTSEEEWDRIINVNLKGVILCSKTAYTYFKKQGSGVIINLSSRAGIVANTNMVAYCAAKGAFQN